MKTTLLHLTFVYLLFMLAEVVVLAVLTILRLVKIIGLLGALVLFLPTRSLSYGAWTKLRKIVWDLEGSIQGMDEESYHLVGEYNDLYWKRKESQCQ